MKVSVNILDFDQAYQMQTYFKKTDYEWIKLSDIRNTSRYCETKDLASIDKRLKKRKDRGITFIGSGNYHYVTYLLMKDIEVPFTLILFDHHTDMKNAPSKSLVSCGSWVLKSIERLPMLKKVIIIGAKEEFIGYIPPSLNNKVLVLSEEQIGQAGIKEYIKSGICTHHVYISIDKDVLGKSEAVTNWDQGNMKLMQLLNLIKFITKNKNICGVDVCGEYPYSPVFNFYPQSLKAVQKNNKANLTILNTINDLKEGIS